MAEISRDDIGKRVTIRLRDVDGYRDIVGHLKSTTSLVNRHGEHIEFNPTDIHIWREIKDVPRTATSGAPLSIRIYELEKIASSTWQPAHEELIGGWLFRADVGITRRANSALVLNTEDHINEVIDWYTARNLKPTISLVPEIHGELDEKFETNGFEHLLDLEVMVKDLEKPSIDFDYQVSDSPNADWLEVHGDQEILKLLSRWPAKYLSILKDNKVIAIGRCAVANDWSILSRIWVAPEFRGQGIGRKMLRALEFESEASKVALQVSTTNLVGKNLYLTAGYKTHHICRFRELPLQTN